MMADTELRANNVWLQLSLELWIIGAQVFYFYEYSPAVASFLRSLSHRVWR
jgi:hypothetical protein